MTIAAEIEKVLTDAAVVDRNRMELDRLRLVLEEAKRTGSFIRQTYDIPLPDTIGRSLEKALRKAR